MFASLPQENVEIVTVNPQVTALRDAYLQAGFISPGSADDAEHVAAATVASVDLLVSWNFRHIVRHEKIQGFEGVNMLNGYRTPRIYSPREVIEL